MRRYTIKDNDLGAAEDGLTLRMLFELTDFDDEDVDTIVALPVGGIVKLSNLTIERTS